MFGRIWAAETATPDELRRLERLDQGGEISTDEDEQSVYTAAERLVFQIDPSTDGNRIYAATFWNVIAGANDDFDLDGDLLRGFCDGAFTCGASQRPGNRGLVPGAAPGLETAADAFAAAARKRLGQEAS